jgi:predicted esterase
MLDTIEMGNTDNPKHIICLLHGYGQNSGEMRFLAARFYKEIPEALIIIPNGLLKAEFSESNKEAILNQRPSFDFDKARSWFDMKSLGKAYLSIIFNKAASMVALDETLNHYFEKYDLEQKDLSYFGFSQGGALSFYHGLSKKETCSAIVAHSSLCPGLRVATSKPPVMMVMGDKDFFYKLPKTKSKNPLHNWLGKQFILPSSLKTLDKKGLDVNTEIIKGQGHSISRKSSELSINFIKNRIS